MSAPIDDLLKKYIQDINELERKSRNRRLNAPTERPAPTTSAIRPSRGGDLPPLHDDAFPAKGPEHI